MIEFLRPQNEDEAYLMLRKLKPNERIILCSNDINSPINTQNVRSILLTAKLMEERGEVSITTRKAKNISLSINRERVNEIIVTLKQHD